MSRSDRLGDFAPTLNLETLQSRATLLKRIRSFFDDRQFIEVETPLLSHDTVVDRHLHPIPVDKYQVTGVSADQGTPLWLQTSPEFAMKRLLAAGATSIYQISRAFRQAEQGAMHNPEFTMLEWYRVGDNMERGINLLCELVEQILGTQPTLRLSYREAFQTHAGVDPFAATLEELAAIVMASGKSEADLEQLDDRDEILNWILSDLVEPHLGLDQPTLVFDYPASQAALARIRPASVEGPEPFDVAERFEIYVQGVELANGYHELCCADELRRRNALVNQQRIQDGNRALPESSRLEQALEHGLPPCAGTALGLDRLVMLATGSTTISEAICFPLSRA